jgi:hypothetical protein
MVETSYGYVDGFGSEEVGMSPTPVFGREFAAARAAYLRAQGGGTRRPARRGRRPTRRWREALGSVLVRIGSRVLAAGGAEDVGEEVRVR